MIIDGVAQHKKGFPNWEAFFRWLTFSKPYAW
jgi:hypothetical protein